MKMEKILSLLDGEKIILDGEDFVDFGRKKWRRFFLERDYCRSGFVVVER